MQTEDSTPEVVEDNLDDFAAEFFGTGKPKEEPKEEAVETGDQEEAPATEDESEAETENTDEDPEGDEEVDNPDDESKFKVKKKLTARERIEQINAKFREKEREAQELAARLAEIEAKIANPEPKVEAKAVEQTGPSPDDKLENGEEKYPLGEYDPDYIRDLHKFEADRAKAEVFAEIEKQRQVEAQKAELKVITENWNTKVAEATERLPDLADKAAELEEALAGTPPEVVESLAMTVMTLENGPEVIYYLAQNPNEARQIARGGSQALIALGKIDAMVKPAKVETKKVTAAPEPPPARARGVQGRFSVPADTDDLDAFSKEFFRR